MEPTSCTICLEALGDIEVDRGITILRCSHAFHAACMMEYAVACGARGSSLSCPVCRSEVVSAPQPMDVIPASVEVIPVTVSAFAAPPRRRLSNEKLRWLAMGLGTFGTLCGCVVVYWLTTDMTSGN